MSPFCPSCLGVLGESERRCPLDNEFPRQRTCKACHAEMYPREVYCAHCGHLNREPKEVLILPPAASPVQQSVSLLLDFLAFGLMAGMLLLPISGLLAVIAGPILCLFYRVLGRSGGRQTLGQAVTHTATVNLRAGPVSFQEALLRSTLEVLRAPFFLLSPRRAEPQLERLTRTIEVTLA